MTQAIDDLLKESLQAPASAESCSKPEKPSSFAAGFSRDVSEFSRAKMCKNEKGECQPLTLASVCEQARDVTWKRYREDTIEFDKKKRRARFHSKELRKKVFAYTQDQFHKIRDNPLLQERCCPQGLLKTDAEKTKCLSFFSKTQLFLLKGLGEEAEEANYQGFTADPLIEISEAKLLYCKNPECIDDTLLHELGHACQYSRGNHVEMFRCEASNPVLEKDLTFFFGNEAAKCVLKDLKSEFKEHKKTLKKGEGKPCLNRWVHEAFADMIFMDQRKSPMAFFAFCRFDDVVDDTHGPKYVNDCVMNQAPYRQALCGPEPDCVQAPLRAQNPR